MEARMTIRCVTLLGLLLGFGCTPGDDGTSGGTLGFGNKDSEISPWNTPTDKVVSDGDVDSDLGSDTDTDTDTDADSDSGTGILRDTDSVTDVPEDTGTESSVLTATDCLTRTPNVERCIDCCDCKGDMCDDRKSCREACASVDYTRNDDFIAVETPSTIGSAGDYMDCFMRGEEQVCKSCCDCSATYACGDYRYCRDVCEDIY